MFALNFATEPLWFPSCEDLNDPFEGMAYIDRSGVNPALFQQYREKFNKRHQGEKHPYLSDEELANGRFDFIRESFRNSAIFSASKAYQYDPQGDNHDHVLGSMALWGHYADGLRGYCIEYNFHKIVQSLQTHNGDRSLNIGTSDVAYSSEMLPVLSIKTYVEDYLSGDTERTFYELQTAFATKFEDVWSCEQEARIFAPKKGEYKINPECIKAVYLGEKMPDWKKQSIKACLEAKGLDICLREVCIDTSGKQYQLRITDYPKNELPTLPMTA